MLKNNKLDELSEMYRLFSKAEDTLKFILAEMGPYIEERGKGLIDDEELRKDPVKFTTQLLKLKKEMDDMVHQCFNNDPKFNQCRDKAFQNFMNNWNETPISIATFCDQLFQKGIKGMTDDQIEEQLSAIIRLFVCLHQRDTFIKAYTKLQA